MLYQVNESSFVFSLLFYRNGRWGHIEFSVWMVVRSNNCTLSKSLLFLQSMICEVMLWVVRTVQCEFALHTVCIWTETCGQTAKIKFVASSETKTVMSTEISNFQLPTEYRSIKSTMLFALCVIKAENAYALHAHTHEIETLEFDVCQCFSGWWLLLHTVSITWNHQKIPFMLVPSENKAAFAVQKKRA